MATIVYTDAGCSGNHGPGGWAFVADMESGIIRRSGGQAATTNNRMELQAVIEALSFIREHNSLSEMGTIVHTDSRYVQKGITEWIKKWLANGWMTSAKKPVKNRDLWQNLYALTEKMEVAWQWVKGHDGIEMNEECDALVQQELAKLRM